MVALAITPLRQLTGQPVLRRLYAFFYASLHLMAYLALDLRGYWTHFLRRDRQVPHIARWLQRLAAAGAPGDHLDAGVGRGASAALGQLHKLVYAIGVLAVLHFWRR